MKFILGDIDTNEDATSDFPKAYQGVNQNNVPFWYLDVDSLEELIALARQNHDEVVIYTFGSDMFLHFELRCD